MSLEPDLTALLRRLKLGKLLTTLPDRLALARAQKLDYAAFLTLVLADDFPGSVALACYSGVLRTASFEAIAPSRSSGW